MSVIKYSAKKVQNLTCQVLKHILPTKNAIRAVLNYENSPISNFSL